MKGKDDAMVRMKIAEAMKSASPKKLLLNVLPMAPTAIHQSKYVLEKVI